LIRQLANGSTSAFETIYNFYFNYVFYFAQKFIKDPQEAEDITTDTFFKCWQKRGDFENIYKLQAFLFITTKNACINAWRSEKRQSDLEQGLKYLLDREDEDAKEQQLLTARIYQYIYEEIEKLPPQEKNIFKMAYIDGLSNDEIASKLNINNLSVRNYKARALKTLRIALAEKNIYHVLLIWLASKYWD
jgi:RNA polymerase sigma-70 factor (ECF subfamily)